MRTLYPARGQARKTTGQDSVGRLLSLWSYLPSLLLRHLFQVTGRKGYGIPSASARRVRKRRKGSSTSTCKAITPATIRAQHRLPHQQRRGRERVVPPLAVGGIREQWGVESGGYRQRSGVLQSVFSAHENRTALIMSLDAWLLNPAFLALLPYLAVDLPSAMRIALLGLAAGLRPKELAALPGLVQAKRRRQTLQALVAAGRVVQVRGSLKCLPSAHADEGAVRRLLKTQTKLQRALELLTDPMVRLKARGLGELAARLNPTLGEGLLTEIENAESALPADRQVRRRARRSLLSFVARRVPPTMYRMTVNGPRPHHAPSDLLERSRELMPERSADLKALYNALAPYGELVLAHWWRILQVFADEGRRGEDLWKVWRVWLESYRLRVRIPLSDSTRLLRHEPRVLKGRFPVPDVGYGVWIGQELALWGKFRTHFGKAVGPMVRDLWIAAHEAVPQLLQQEHAGATPSLVSPEHYEDVLFRAADAVSGLSAAALAALHSRQGSAALRAARANARREWNGITERAAILKAVRLARGVVKQTPKETDRRAWAIDLLEVIARRAAGERYDSKRLAKLVAQAGPGGGRGGRRIRRRKLGERVVRELHSGLYLRPVHVGPGDSFPLRNVWQRIRIARRTIETAAATLDERSAALEQLREYVQHRAHITLVYADGVPHRITIVEALSFVSGPERAATIASAIYRRLSPRAGTGGVALRLAA